MDAQTGNNPHRPFRWEAAGSDTAVLLVHGIFGSPRQFEGIARVLLGQGCSVMAVLLPGHGGSAKDFSEAKAALWQQAVFEAAASLRQRYPRVVLLGHSMGGLLCIREAAAHGANGVILLSVPMRLKSSMRALRMSAKVLWSDPARDDDFLKRYRLAYSVGKGTLWRYLLWTPRMADLTGLIGKARRALRLVTAPVLIIQSRRDETVSWKSAGMLEQGLQSAAAVETLLLERSSHACFDPAEEITLQEKICGFVKGRSDK